MYRDSTGCMLVMAGEVGGISVCAGMWITQPVGMYWSSLCWQGRNEGIGGTTLVLWSGCTRIVHCGTLLEHAVEMGTQMWWRSLVVSQQRCWCEEAVGACRHS